MGKCCAFGQFVVGASDALVWLSALSFSLFW